MVWVVARMEWRERSHYPQLKWTVLLLGLLAAAVAIPAQYLRPEPRPVTYRVGVVGALPVGTEEMLDIDRPSTVHVAFAQADRASAEAGVRSGHLAAAVADGQVLGLSNASSPAVVLLRRALARAAVVERLRRAGVDPGEAKQLGAVAPAPLKLLAPASEARKTNTALAKGGAVATGFLVFFIVQFLSNGIQEERARRMADVLLVPLRPGEVIAGKILGVEALGLSVFGLMAAPAAIVAVAFHGAHVVGLVPMTVLATVAWFVLQLGFYGCLAATTAATARSPDEAGLSSMKGSVLLGLGSVAATTAGPTGPGLAILSFLPPVAAPVMLVRAAAADVAAWEVVVSMALLAASTVLMGRVASRVYLGGVVRAGEKLKVRSAYRAGREWTGVGDGHVGDQAEPPQPTTLRPAEEPPAEARPQRRFSPPGP